jgi:hypothetical protein
MNKRSQENTIYQSPAEIVRELFEGIRPAAKRLGRNPSSVSKWQTYKNSKGEIGRVPASLYPKIIAEARALRKRVTYKDLVEGRYISKRKD